MRAFDFIEVLYQLLAAAKWTVALSFIALIGGGLLGMVLTLALNGPIRPLCWISKAGIQFIQGTPLLMQLFLIYFGLPLFLGVNVSAWAVACIALIIFTSAYLAEIWSSCIHSIPIAQWESASSLGLGHLQQLRYVIMPQALKIAIPPSVGFSAQVIKGTSLTSIIGFLELTRIGQAINNVTFKPFIVYSMVALIYFSLCYPISFYSRKMEKKLNVTG